AARRRRGEHPDALRDVPRRRARRALALCHRRALHGGRARGRAAQPPRAARHRPRRPDGLDHLEHRAAARARVARDGPAVPDPPHVRGGPRDPHGDAHPHRQPARARGRPPRQRGGRLRPHRRPRHLRRLRDGRELRRRLGRRGVPGRRHRARGRGLPRRAHHPRREAAEDRPRPAAQRDRQEHGGRHPLRGDLRLRRAGRRHRPAPAGGARGGGRHHRHGRPGARDRPVHDGHRRARRPPHAQGAQAPARAPGRV
ncbi:MAG: Pantothenate kinase type III, CoaX-like, partial [uncultured Solirubrobacteraceae bacterium]